MKSYLFKITTHAPVHDTHHRTIYSDSFNKAVLAAVSEAYPFGLKAIEFQLELVSVTIEKIKCCGCGRLWRETELVRDLCISCWGNDVRNIRREK